jgi:hypothetical protein
MPVTGHGLFSLAKIRNNSKIKIKKVRNGVVSRTPVSDDNDSELTARQCGQYQSTQRSSVKKIDAQK